jgi:hypothetical protein
LSPPCFGTVETPGAIAALSSVAIVTMMHTFFNFVGSIPIDIFHSTCVNPWDKFKLNYLQAAQSEEVHEKVCVHRRDDGNR